MILRFYCAFIGGNVGMQGNGNIFLRVLWFKQSVGKFYVFFLLDQILFCIRCLIGYIGILILGIR